MARKGTASPDIKERLTVLETEWPHLEKAVKETAEHQKDIRRELRALVRHYKALMLLVTAVAIHFIGGSIAGAFAHALLDAARSLLKL